MINGHATVGGTADYLRKFDFTKRETPWFVTSPIAIGTHLGEMTDADSVLYRKAIQYALSNGINFIDTAINYRGMKSERDIGVVLKELIKENEFLKREEIVISTKAGIIPGDIDAKLVPTVYLQNILLDKGIINELDLNVVEHHRHVLTPNYFEFAMTESRKHLNLETIDIYYLHNPEISMMVLGQDEFYRQLYSLFSYFEEQVMNGYIRHYGMATWDAFLYNPEDAGYISLEKVVEIAKSVTDKQHHFRFIQLPYSQNKPQAVQKKNQRVGDNWRTMLQASKELGLFIMTSAPFNMGEALTTGDKADCLLSEVIHTQGILSTMTGMKRLQHVKANLSTIKMCN